MICLNQTKGNNSFPQQNNAFSIFWYGWIATYHSIAVMLRVGNNALYNNLGYNSSSKDCLIASSNKYHSKENMIEYFIFE